MWTEQQLITQILATPDDDGPRLAYADWLTEHSDPRGRYIAAACQLEQIGKDDPLYEELYEEICDILHEYELAWIGELSELVDRWVFRRGFVEFVATSARNFVDTAERLFELAPIRFVALSGTLDGPRLSELPQLAHLQGLALDRCILAAGDLAALGSCSSLSKLQRLTASGCGLSDEALELLAQTDALTSLQMLDLSNNGITNRGIRSLIAWPALANLESLWLSGNQFRLTGARDLAGSQPLVDNLKHLDVRGNRLLSRRAIDALRNKFGDRVAVN